MIVEVTLVCICLLDASFCGFRDAAGRNRLIRKWGYLRRAIITATALGLVVVGLIAATVVLGVGRAPDPTLMYNRYLVAGATMLRVYVPFTSLVLVALGFFAIPKPHIRSLSTVTILGPFTCLRPFAITAGALWAAASTREPAIWLSLAACVVLVVPLGYWVALLKVNTLSMRQMVALESHTKT